MENKENGEYRGDEDYIKLLLASAEMDLSIAENILMIKHTQETVELVKSLNEEIKNLLNNK